MRGRPSATPPRTVPLRLTQVVDLVTDRQPDAFGRGAELVDERPERPVPLGEMGVVPLDHHQTGHGPARHRVALAGLPVERPAPGLGALVGRVVEQRYGDDVAADPETSLGQAGELRSKVVEQVEVASAHPTERRWPG